MISSIKSFNCTRRKLKNIPDPEAAVIQYCRKNFDRICSSLYGRVPSAACDLHGCDERSILFDVVQSMLENETTENIEMLMMSQSSFWEEIITSTTQLFLVAPMLDRTDVAILILNRFKIEILFGHNFKK